MGHHTSVLTYTMGIVEDKEKGKEKKKEEGIIMAENFQNVIKGTNLYIREVQQTPGWINAKILTLIIFMILKFLEAKDKEIISKVAETCFLINTRPLKRLTENYSSETMEVRKKWDDFFFWLHHMACRSSPD